MNLRLEFPTDEHKKMYEEAMKQWGSVEIIPTSPGRFFVGENFEEFLKIIRNDVENNENGVNSTLFFLIGEDKIMGAIQIRHNIVHPNLIEVGGHIGYGILPKYRKKGYGTIMLELCILEVEKLGLKRVLITCDYDNIGSAKIIESNGGVFERLTNDGTKKRYWIEVHINNGNDYDINTL